MDDPFAVTVIDTLHDLLEQRGSLFFSKELLFDNLVEQLSSTANFSYEVVVLVVLKILVEF